MLPPRALRPARRDPRVIVAAGVVVLAGAIALIVATRPQPNVATEQPSAEAPRAAVERPREAPAAAEGSAKGSSVSPADPEVPALAPTVRIDIQGVPPKTTLTVDGHPASFPLELPRGTRSHRIVLKPPGVPEKVLEVDGTRDRLIELVFEAPRGGQERGAGRAARDKTLEKSASGRSSRERSGSGDKKPPSGGPSDREAITDI